MKEKKFPKHCFLIIDMQNDFLSQKGSFAKMGINIKNLQNVIPRIKKLKNSFKNQEVSTIYIVSNYDDIYITDSISERYKRIGYHIPFCVSGSWGAQIVNQLKPEKKDKVVIKYRYNGFLGTSLEFILKSMNISNLILSGIETHVCVQQTGIHGFMLGFNVILVEDCLTSINENDRKYALDYCKRYYGIVKSSKEVLEIPHLV